MHFHFSSLRDAVASNRFVSWQNWLRGTVACELMLESIQLDLLWQNHTSNINIVTSSNIQLIRHNFYRRMFLKIIYIYFTVWNFRHRLVRHHWYVYFDLSDYQFPFFSQISASTVSKQITCNHFGLIFQADSDRTVFRVLPENRSVLTMIHLSSLLSFLFLLTSEAQKSGCDLKHAECLDEKQVFVQLRSELRDSKDSDSDVAARPRWRWRRRNGRYHPHHPYGPSTATRNATSTTTSTTTSTATSTTTSTATSTTTSTATSTTTSTTTIPVCLGNNVPNDVGAQDSTFVASADNTTTVLLEVDGEQTAGCCVDDVLNSVRIRAGFIWRAGSGIMVVSLEPPNMQSQFLANFQIGNPTFDLSFGDKFPGAVARGTWKLTFVVPSTLTGWSAEIASTLDLKVDQCVWLKKDGEKMGASTNCTSVKWVSRKVCLRCVFSTTVVHQFAVEFRCQV